MTDPRMTAVVALGVDLVEPTHPWHAVRLGCLHKQVVVVVHQAPGITAPTLLSDLPGQGIDERLPVVVIGNNVSACIADITTPEGSAEPSDPDLKLNLDDLTDVADIDTGEDEENIDPKMKEESKNAERKDNDAT